MSSVNPFKPVLSTIIALVWLSCFTFIDTGPSGFLRSFFNQDEGGANVVKWTTVIAVGVVWLLVQLFLDATSDASNLSLAISGSILWLGLLLFFNFAQKGYGGTVAFFALMGGLAVVIIWTRYLADEF